MTDFTPHPFLPMRAVGLLDPNICASAGCGQAWDAPAHQPSLYLAAQESKISAHHAVIEEAARKAAKGTGVPPALLPYERPSGPPRDPSADALAATWENTAAPATHTGRPAFHSGDSGLRIAQVGKPGRGKTLLDPAQTLAAGLLRDMGDGLKHLATVQDSEVWEVPTVEDAKATQAALASLKVEAVHVPLGAPKCPKDGCDLTHPHLHSKAEMAEGDPLDNYCEHPNGFGVNGCPCGAVAPDEDAPRMFRNVDTGKDEYAIRCPATLDHAYDVYPVSQMLRHLGRDHGWSQERIDDWAESTGVATQSLVPDPLVEDMAQRTQRQAELDDFLNPKITMEEIMSVDRPKSLEEGITEWWLERAAEEAKAVVPKAIAYGSNSLMQLGRKMAQLQGREVSDDEALELGCWANLVQKVERMTDSVMRGERCSDDTVYDVGVYIKMVQRIRDAGSWPGV